MNKTFTIKYNESDNPWIAKYIDISFSTEKITKIANEMIKACSDKNYNASYHYDKHVENIISNHWDKDLGAIRPFYQAILTLLKTLNVEDPNNWHDGNIAARRVLQNKIAYSTPGFIEAKRYSELFGG